MNLLIISAVTIANITADIYFQAKTEIKIYAKETEILKNLFKEKPGK